MPKEALADLILVWETMLTGMDERMAEFPHLKPLRDELAAMLEQIKALAAEQSSLEARRQAVTQQMRILKADGKDLAVRVRAALRSFYGHRNEGLVRFRMRPLRRRSRGTPESVGVATWPVAATPAAPPTTSAGPEALPAESPISPAADGDSHSES
ncbi:MAG TPA: hypothetical protein VF173_08030 [Thermoanaerobaculia bacterium]|nr:hypothetical protein [Thermoanaerobaculia bacterium]